MKRRVSGPTTAIALVPGEARQVADVDEVGDEQQVDLALAEAGGDAVRAAHMRLLEARERGRGSRRALAR